MPIAASDQQSLMDAALVVREKAFAPYSDFRVGAAILTAQGNIVVGCNVENASYGLAICAERGAVMAMVASGETELQAIAVASRRGATPCGACRQVLAEFGTDFDVLLIDSDTNELVSQWNIADLLPGVFRLS